MKVFVCRNGSIINVPSQVLVGIEQGKLVIRNENGDVADIPNIEPILTDRTPEPIYTYAVRLIWEDGDKMRCIAEEIFEKMPTETQISWCLLKHPEASFASVVQRYSLIQDEDLPFA